MAAAAHPMQLWVLGQSSPVVVAVVVVVEVEVVQTCQVEAAVEVEVAEVVVALLRFQQPLMIQSGLGGCLVPFDHV